MEDKDGVIICKLPKRYRPTEKQLAYEGGTYQAYLYPDGYVRYEGYIKVPFKKDNEMEDKDLNLAIAKYKNLDVAYIVDDILFVKEWYGCFKFFDYINDPALNQELLLELSAAGWCYYYDADEKVHRWEKEYPDENTGVERFDDEHFGRATAHAYHKQFIGDL